MPKKNLSWLERAQKEGTPLIDGGHVTFVWRGEDAPLLAGDFTDWQPVLMAQTAPNCWIYQVQIPDDAYLEYAYLSPADPPQRLADPFNQRQITNGMGNMNYHFSMPKAQHTKLVRRQKGIKRGTLKKHALPGLGGRNFVGTSRLVYTYQPPTKAPVPLLVVLDGKDFATRANLPAIVDNLIHNGRIRPIALAMPDNGRGARIAEYMCNDLTLSFLTRDLFKLAADHCNLLDIQTNPGAYGMLGASMGGLMSLYAGLRLPHIFGTVISLSGAFGFSIIQESIIYDLVRYLPVRQLDIWMNVGRYEWLTEVNRDMYKGLRERGYRPFYREYNGGHNYTSWRDEVVIALEEMYGR
jgi:enterochelin esterase-like enzyme